MLYDKPHMRPFFSVIVSERTKITIQILDVAQCHADIIVSEVNPLTNRPINLNVLAAVAKDFPTLNLFIGGLRITPAFSLPAKDILHVMRLNDSYFDLSYTYNIALEHAGKMNVRTIAFPVIGKIQEYKTQAAIAFNAIYKGIDNLSIKRVYICVPHEDYLKAYLHAAQCFASTKIVPV